MVNRSFGECGTWNTQAYDITNWPSDFMKVIAPKCTIKCFVRCLLVVFFFFFFSNSSCSLLFFKRFFWALWSNNFVECVAHKGTSNRKWFGRAWEVANQRTKISMADNIAPNKWTHFFFDNKSNKCESECKDKTKQIIWNKSTAKAATINTMRWRWRRKERQSKQKLYQTKRHEWTVNMNTAQWAHTQSNVAHLTTSLEFL